ncbi:MAG: hypothetical protein C7B44_09270 [Sulfobacillus thermosulfidooxidans]|uniref:hypothetical protein n=1 Tax=Sulfobacillus TaxID=28033 RepID=UPI000CCFFDED|nr:hypothetical protein [Sulfobacillus sp. hq2]MCY0906914.1 hypothetical protein [Sulfobacillus thermotolerans]POB11659.1 hypothetical protein CO251_03545 [Sulfobacillus sp. hq2]PSR36389.1 MAG: hypothetical protein C7B44_09270 [Sulfobacillus thermosulfidooxidans]
MQTIHDNKPALSTGTGSIFVDLIFWKPKATDMAPLTAFLQETHLGERSQTVLWLNKITVRLSMWNGTYLADLPTEYWPQAQKDLQTFIAKTMEYYRIPKAEYDTRAFTVGLTRKVHRQKVTISQLTIPQPQSNNPVWWVITP